MSVVRMVVLIERASPDSTVAVSRGWIVPETLFNDLDDTLHRVFGPPVQEGMRDLESRQDIWVHPEDAGPAAPTGTAAGPTTGEDGPGRDALNTDL